MAATGSDRSRGFECIDASDAGFGTGDVHALGAEEGGREVAVRKEETAKRMVNSD